MNDKNNKPAIKYTLIRSRKLPVCVTLITKRNAPTNQNTSELIRNKRIIKIKFYQTRARIVFKRMLWILSLSIVHTNVILPNSVVFYWILMCCRLDSNKVGLKWIDFEMCFPFWENYIINILHVWPCIRVANEYIHGDVMFPPENSVLLGI